MVDGYWNKPAATAATFVDGWLHTGDLARVDDGLVRVVDRAKDMINRGGENVYSVEVENALAGAPGVTEGAVVGVPDDVMGEKVGAVLVGSGIDVDAVLAHLATQIADFKLPQYVVVSPDPLPRNPGGSCSSGPCATRSTGVPRCVAAEALGRQPVRCAARYCSGVMASSHVVASVPSSGCSTRA